jgi:2-polyprenyl-3-methyl-5-hydroxy-6-metoxy-1,4-benzoquinol methylase
MIEKKKNLLDQSKKEAEFFDTEYADANKRHRLQNYKVPDKFIREVTHPSPCPLIDREYAYSLLGNLEGKKLLDYGAGDGWNTVCFAKAKAKVWAIDISAKGIELTIKKGLANGVSEFITAEVQNCYETKFKNNMFDIIYGGGILHHLDIEAAGQELSRLLHPEGVAVFYEPIRETRAMDIIRAIAFRVIKRKPSEETEDETPLTIKKIGLLRPYFEVINCRHFNVMTSASLLIKSRKLHSILLRTDYLFLKYFPGFKKLARAVVIELRKPKKDEAYI